MKKGLFGMLLCLFLLPFVSVKAEGCDYTELATLKKEAANIKANYEIKSEDVVKVCSTIDAPDSEGKCWSSRDYANITILNFTDKFYLVKTDAYNTEPVTYYYNNFENNIFSYTIDDFSKLNKQTYKVYASSNTSCPGENVGIFYLTVPRRNSLSDTLVCEGHEDSEYCQDFVSFEDVSAEKVDELLNPKKDSSDSKKDGDVSNKSNIGLIVGVGAAIVIVAGASFIVLSKKGKKL